MKLLEDQKLIQKLEKKWGAWSPFKISEEHIMHSRKYYSNILADKLQLEAWEITWMKYLNFINTHFLEVGIYWKVYWDTQN